MSTATNKSEKQVAGAGYILSFFNEIDILTQIASIYINNITRMKIKYGDIKPDTKFNDEDMSILNSIEQVKGVIFRTFIKFTSLKSKIIEFKNLDKENKGKNIQTVESMYKRIRDSAVPEITDIEGYTLRLNNLFVEAIEILTAAQGIYQAAVNAASLPGEG